MTVAYNNEQHAELARVTAQRDALARYINTLDIDEDVCKHSTNCKEDPTETDCLNCIVDVLGRGVKEDIDER